MDLLIVRHAIAFERNRKRWPDDADRPLSPEGIARARKAAAGLKKLVERPERVLTSPLVRAKQTAALLTEVAGWPKAIETEALVPGQPPEELLEGLEADRNQEALVAVVGHEPDLGRLIAAALRGGTSPVAFPLKKFGMAHLSFPARPRPGRATLNWLLPPKVLRAIRN